MLPPESKITNKAINPYSAADSSHAVQPAPAPGEVIMSAAHLPAALREDIEDAPFWKEVVAFSKIPQSSLDAYYGKFIAIYNGDVVDSDHDEGELALRFYRTFGYVPVYIHRVGVEDDVIDLE